MDSFPSFSQYIMCYTETYLFIFKMNDVIAIHGGMELYGAYKGSKLKKEESKLF